MATIALYKSQADQMNQLISDTMVSVDNYISELSSVKNNAFYVNTSVCNLEDVISSIVSSIDTQELKFSALDTMWLDTETFVWNVDVIDQDVADLINEAKEDFYDDYEYLRPDCEKNAVVDWFEDGLAAAGEWCKEHWKVIAIVILVALAVVLIVLSGGALLAILGPAFCTILAGIGWGILGGVVLGGLIGGLAGLAVNGDFWAGAEDGAFAGAVAGAITGPFGPLMEGSIAATMIIGGGSSAFAAFLGNLGDAKFAGEDISTAEYIVDSLLSGVFGALTSGAGFKISSIPGLSAWAQATQGAAGVTVKNVLKTIVAKMPEEAIEFGSDAAQEGIDKLMPWNSNIVIDLVTDVGDWASDTGEQVGDWVSDTGDQISDWASDTSDWVSDTGDQISDWASDTGDQISDWASDTGNQFSDWASDTGNQFSDWASDTGNQFSNWASDTGDLFKDIVTAN